jgi:hypothetical protein
MEGGKGWMGKEGKGNATEREGNGGEGKKGGKGGEEKRGQGNGRNGNWVGSLRHGLWGGGWTPLITTRRAINYRVAPLTSLRTSVKHCSSHANPVANVIM